MTSNVKIQYLTSGNESYALTDEELDQLYSDLEEKFSKEEVQTLFNLLKAHPIIIEFAAKVANVALMKTLPRIAVTIDQD